MDEAFVAYLNGLDDQHEAELANACFMALTAMVEENWDDLPKCRKCGSILCPHCGKHGKEPAAA